MSEHMAYIGRKACGCVVAAVVDVPAHRRDTGRAIGQFARDGLTVERVTVEFAREHLQRCTHRQKQATAQLEAQL